MPAYSIIVELGHGVLTNLDTISHRLGTDALRWVQLGPPALEADNLATYKIAHSNGQVDWFGVEDYTLPMLQRFARELPISTVQQEINAIVRPSSATLAFCRSHGCRFVAYGPLLGGLLADRFLGLPKPVPDADHSKQRDYLESIESWADWGTFQRLLHTLRVIGDDHGPASIAAVALAYTLQLDSVVAAIVGVRLGVGGATHHHRDSLVALSLHLSQAEVRAIDEAVNAGIVLDGLART